MATLIGDIQASGLTPSTQLAGRICVGKSDRSSHEYQVGDWRKAFSRYLDGVWEQLNANAGGFLIIGDIVLDLQNGDYRFTSPAGLQPIKRPSFNRDQIHAVTSQRNDLELGLAKFVRNNYIRQLVIEFPTGRLMFWKGPRRTDLFVTVTDRTF